MSNAVFQWLGQVTPGQGFVCPPFYTFDPARGACVPSPSPPPTCPSGTHLDAVTNLCVPDIVITPTSPVVPQPQPPAQRSTGRGSGVAIALGLGALALVGATVLLRR